MDKNIIVLQKSAFPNCSKKLRDMENQFIHDGYIVVWLNYNGFWNDSSVGEWINFGTHVVSLFVTNNVHLDWAKTKKEYNVNIYYVTNEYTEQI